MVRKHTVYDWNSLILLQTSFMTQNMDEYIAKMSGHSEIVTSMRFTYNWSQCPETAASSSSRLLEAAFAGDQPLGAAAVEHKGQEVEQPPQEGDQYSGLRCAPWALESRWGMRRPKSVNPKRCWRCRRKRAWVQILSVCWSTATTLGKAAGESAWKVGHRGANKVAPFSMPLVFLGTLSPWHLCFPWRTSVLLPVSIYTAFHSSHKYLLHAYPVLLTLFMGFSRQEYWSGSPSLLQWTMFCQNSPPWLVHLGLEGFPW